VTPAFDTDWIVVASPLLGAAINIFFQIGLLRLRRGRWLTRSIVEASVVGAVITIVGTTIARLYGATSLLDGVGLAVSALAVYLSASFVLFALVNLGQTSLRVRMIGHLVENPDGLSPGELLKLHPETVLIEVRIRKMKDSGWIRVVEGRFYPKLSAVSLAAAGMSLLKWMLYARRRGLA
jgi:hypothetical protein